jgi:CheY-like chemotaxis protein
LKGTAEKGGVRAAGDKNNNKNNGKNVDEGTPQQRLEGTSPSEGGGGQNLLVHLPIPYVEPFDFILMDIQMPVMGKSSYFYVLLLMPI